VAEMPGVAAYYYLYEPTVSTQASFFLTDLDGDGVFDREQVTQINDYEEGDREHVAWYYEPIAAGHAIWLEPYYNANIGADIISYVIPLYRENNDHCIGVIGMDIRTDLIQETVRSIHAYETDYAFLTDVDGHVYYHPNLETGISILDLTMDQDVIAPVLLSQETVSDVVSYRYDGQTRYLAVCPLRNGMRLALCITEQEVLAPGAEAARRFILAAALFVAGALVIALLLLRRTMKPLSDLTQTARSISGGDLNATFPEVTGDEVGELNRTMRGMVDAMKNRIYGLSDQARRDALTGVRNKRAFDEEADSLNHTTEPFALVMLDMNGLKEMNDQYGHEKGDELIQNSCRLICEVFSHCPVFRYGGDEFVAVLRGDSLRRADDIISDLNARQAVTADDPDPAKRISIAVGMAEYDPSKSVIVSDPAGVILKQADNAMYEDKRKKKGGRDPR